MLTRTDLRVINSEVQRPASAADLASVPVRELVGVLVEVLTAWLAAQDAPPALTERENGGRR